VISLRQALRVIGGGMTRLLTVVIGFLLFSNASHALAQANALNPPIEPLSRLPLPLLDGEELVRLADGCHMVVESTTPSEAKAATAARRWLGACRFGLMEGPGFLVDSEATNDPQEWKAHLGRADTRGSRPNYEYYPRNAVRDTAVSFEIYDSPEAAREAVNKSDFGKLLPESLAGGRAWTATLANVVHRNDHGEVGESVMVRSEPCPFYGQGASIAEQLKSTLAATPAHLAALVPFCEAALKRIKREGRMPDYFNLEYHYFHSVTVTRWTPAGSTSEKTIGPTPGDVASCESLWRPVVTPWLAEREIERKREKERESMREALAKPLEAAFLARIQRRFASNASRKAE
jgi:hypothetical protein